jgi:hypothetical protein
MTRDVILPVSVHMMTGEMTGEQWRVIVVNDRAVIDAGTFDDRDSALAFARVIRWSGTVHMIPAHTCPRCAGPIPSANARGQYPGAISRRFAGVEICSDCGTAEAFHDFYGTHSQGLQWWIAGD